MKRAATCFLGIILWIGLQAQPLTDATEIVRRADSKMRGQSSEAIMHMTIERPGWSRTVGMKSWSKGDDYALILITDPPRDKGQVYLKRGREMWNWVPSIERIVKIPPSMMNQGWMGSDFTNDDLVRQSSIVRDYTHTLLGTEEIRGSACYKIELIPKPDAAVVWGKLIVWISRDGFDMLKAEYYDEDNQLINTEQAYDIRPMGDRSIPTRLEIIPAQKPGQKTTLTIEKIRFNVDIPDSFFTLQHIKQLKP